MAQWYDYKINFYSVFSFFFHHISIIHHSTSTQMRKQNEIHTRNHPCFYHLIWKFNPVWQIAKTFLVMSFFFFQVEELNYHNKSGKHYARHTEPLDCCFNLIKSHLQCILWSFPVEIEPVTTECRSKTLPLVHITHFLVMVIQFII